MQKRLLLCDDEPHILRAAEFKFTRAGFDVACAVDGEDAWHQMQQHRPDIVITDCQMPRLDGIGLIERMRQSDEFADLPVVMLTAKGYELARAELREKFNVLSIMAKPFSPRELLRLVESTLAEQSTEAATR